MDGLKRAGADQMTNLKLIENHNKLGRGDVSERLQTLKSLYVMSNFALSEKDVPTNPPIEISKSKEQVFSHKGSLILLASQKKCQFSQEIMEKIDFLNLVFKTENQIDDFSSLDKLTNSIFDDCQRYFN